MTNALIIVDLQPTFMEGGELPVTGGQLIAADVAEFVALRADNYDLIATTQDWHVDPGEHFSDTPDFVDSWPPHGVAGSENAEVHPALSSWFTPHVAIKKGQLAAAYSGFEGADEHGTLLETHLSAHDVTHVDVVGLALSHCVLQTALDAKQLGYHTRVLLDLTAPVSRELGEAAIRRLLDAGVEITTSNLV